MIIGLTGGIATGKSTVAKILFKLGAHVIDADKITHNIYQKNKQAYKKVVDFFGKNILDNKGEIDRNKLGEIVFSDKEKLKNLENIIHPFIIKEIEDKINEKKTEFKHIVVDAPLLYETGLDEIVEQVWVVAARRSIQLKRIVKRDLISKSAANKRIESQMPLEKKKELADYVIINEGTLSELKSKVFKKWKKINQL